MHISGVSAKGTDGSTSINMSACEDAEDAAEWLWAFITQSSCCLLQETMEADGDNVGSVAQGEVTAGDFRLPVYRLHLHIFVFWRWHETKQQNFFTCGLLKKHFVVQIKLMPTEKKQKVLSLNMHIPAWCTGVSPETCFHL